MSFWHPRVSYFSTNGMTLRTCCALLATPESSPVPSAIVANEMRYALGTIGTRMAKVRPGILHVGKERWLRALSLAINPVCDLLGCY
jgi:hypothetical protein